MRTKLEKLEQQLTKHASEEDAKFYSELSRRVFGKASTGFLESHDSETLAAILQGAIKLIGQKEPNEIRVRATNPRYDVDGWESPKTALEVSMRDRPFIVDSISHELKRMGLELQFLVHPIIKFQRDKDGQLKKEFDGPDSVAEVYELFLVERVPDEQLPELERRVRSVLEDVRVATDDYPALRQQVDAICKRLSHLA
ncbi:MAG TPA: hypothetical protein EYO33_10635, partial [Phycisphaerales bacterium]|nr:hypothetical protein [Phycisphaerales bacterium]